MIPSCMAFSFHHSLKFQLLPMSTANSDLRMKAWGEVLDPDNSSGVSGCYTTANISDAVHGNAFNSGQLDPRRQLIRPDNMFSSGTFAE